TKHIDISFTRLVAELGMLNITSEVYDGHIALNNSVAILESKCPEHQDMLQFLSKCCISKALVIQPSATYNKYLRDFWYSAEVEDNTISFSLLNVKKTLSFDRDIFASVIGLEYSKEYVSMHDHDVVKDAIATLGLSDEKDSEMTSLDLAHSSPLRIRYFSPKWKVLMTYLVKCLGGNQGSHDQLNAHRQMIAYALCWGLNIDIAGVLYDDLISKLSAGGNKGREKKICYIRYLSLVMEHLLGKDYVNNELNPTKSFLITSETFKKSTLPKVPLTSHMRKVAKLDEDPLITPSEETHIEASGIMSLFGTSKLSKLEANRFVHLQEELSKMTTLVSLMASTEVIQKTTAEGEKDKEKPNEVNDQELEQANIQGELNVEMVNTETTMIVHSSEGKGSEEKKADESESDDDEPIAKRLKVLIPTPKPLQSIIPDPSRDLTPSRDPSKGKEIATEEDPLKQLVPFLEQSRSDPKAINLHQFSEYGKKMTLKEAHEQIMYLKRIAD
ncbi:hypothetical protein Tco_1075940, partial [Tanacetum coccineum]